MGEKRTNANEEKVRAAPQEVKSNKQHCWCQEEKRLMDDEESVEERCPRAIARERFPVTSTSSTVQPRRVDCR